VRRRPFFAVAALCVAVFAGALALSRSNHTSPQRPASAARLTVDTRVAATRLPAVEAGVPLPGLRSRRRAAGHAPAAPAPAPKPAPAAQPRRAPAPLQAPAPAPAPAPKPKPKDPGKPFFDPDR
jgi:hypothetical protein